MEAAMSDDLVYRIFVEIAVLEGKREPDGRWLVNDGQEIPRLLKRAFGVVSRAAAAREEDPASVAKTFGGKKSEANKHPPGT